MLFVLWVGVAGVVTRQIQVGGAVTDARKWGKWELVQSECRDRKARADLLPQQQAMAWQDQTVKTLNWGFGLGSVGEGGEGERRRVRAEA